jgi:hypothetical protein
MDDSSAELNLIAKITSFNSSKKNDLAEIDFPALPALIGKSSTEKFQTDKSTVSEDNTNILQEDIQNNNIEDSQGDTKMEENSASSDPDETEDNSGNSYSAFTKLYPQNYPPDWPISPANYYTKPNTKEIVAIDSSLLSENERRIALCLAPFSKEFFIATGYSKLQLPEDYLELTRVIVWYNRQRQKRGLLVMSPREFVKFLFVEMSQDFQDLGIDIPDFLDDLIKIRYAKNQAFDTYNNYIQNQKDIPKIKDNTKLKQETQNYHIKNEQI